MEGREGLAGVVWQKSNNTNDCMCITETVSKKTSEWLMLRIGNMGGAS